jgi:hypothetical protein
MTLEMFVHHVMIVWWRCVYEDVDEHHADVDLGVEVLAMKKQMRRQWYVT